MRTNPTSRSGGLLVATILLISSAHAVDSNARLDAIGALPGHVRSEARGVSADGSLVVGRSASNAHGQAIFERDPSERAIT